MKILHISRTMGQGGAEKVVYQICRDDKRDIHFVASCGGVNEKKLNQLGVKHYLIPDIDNKNPLKLIKTYFVLLNIVKNNNIQIVHSHHRMAAFYARLLQFRFRKLKHVYTAHNVFYGKRRLLNFALKKANIVACGKTVKQNLIEEYGINSKKIRVIFNSIKVPKNPRIEDKKIDKILSDKNKYYIGSIGRLSEQKGMDVFIKAIAKVSRFNPNIEGVIVGEGEEKQNLIELVKRERLNNILFLGFQNDVYGIMKKMKFIVLASRWEGFPLTPIECFATGRTIIVSDIPNNLEIVQPGYNGMSFKKNSVDDLAQKILLMVKKRVVFEENSLKTYSDRFDYNIFIDKYKRIYNIAMSQNDFGK